MKKSILSTVAILVAATQLSACQPTGDVVETDRSDRTVLSQFQVAANTVGCNKGGPLGQATAGRCLIVNGERFSESISGYTHQEGVAHVLKVERKQICDPDVFNSCPQDIGSIYKYRLLSVVE